MTNLTFSSELKTSKIKLSLNIDSIRRRVKAKKLIVLILKIGQTLISRKIYHCLISWFLAFNLLKYINRMWRNFIKSLVKQFPKKSKSNRWAFLSLGLWPFKGHTHFLTKIRQITDQDNIQIKLDQNWMYFESFYVLAFDLCKGQTHFLTKIHQITG